MLAQIQVINARAERANNDLYAANQQLARINADLTTNTRHLKIARESLVVAQARVSARLRALYMHGGDGGTVAILLGAQSLDDLVNRLDAEKRVDKQDTSVLHDVKTFRREVELRQQRLTDARAPQSQGADIVYSGTPDLMAEYARLAAKRSVENDLARANQLYNSVKGEIVKLQVAERARQALLAAQARARLAAEQQQLAAAKAAAANPNPTPDPGATTLPSVDSAIPAAPPSPYGNVVGIAMQYLGVPYVWGGSTPNGFDCSGFTAWVYAQVVALLDLEGDLVGRNRHDLALRVEYPDREVSDVPAVGRYGVPVDRSQLEPGDLVFFDGLGHVGLYIGGGQFIHAPHTGDFVKISAMIGWYDSNYVGARRISSSNNSN